MNSDGVCGYMFGTASGIRDSCLYPTNYPHETHRGSSYYFRILPDGFIDYQFISTDKLVVKEPRIKIYRDKDDWWIGYYRGKTHHYVCILPTIVIRWNR